jgi:AmmeMemoRadiSam system protein A
MNIDELVAQHGALLLDVAEHSIRDELERGIHWSPDPEIYPRELAEPGCCFVTLERNDVLLGCVGSTEPVGPLIVDVARRARAAAVADPRFSGISADDFETMTIEVSVLSALVPMDVHSWTELAGELRLGIDGLLVSNGRRAATFLPAVWRHVRSTSEFLDLLWRKAGFPPRSWSPSMRVDRYTTAQVQADPPRERLVRTGWMRS